MTGVDVMAIHVEPMLSPSARSAVETVGHYPAAGSVVAIMIVVVVIVVAITAVMVPGVVVVVTACAPVAIRFIPILAEVAIRLVPLVARLAAGRLDLRSDRYLPAVEVAGLFVT